MRSQSVGAVALVIMAMGAGTAAAQPTILPSSIVRVRADNHFGVTKDDVIAVSSFAGNFQHSILDTEIGTAAQSTNAATYAFTFSGTTAVFDVQTTQSHTAGSTGNLTEGFIQFVLAEPYVFEVSGNLTGASADAGDAYQQRTFLRQFASPFATQYLEDETRTGTLARLYVNQSDDTGGGTFNQSGPAIGVLPPGTYEFSYELESNDRDNDQAVAGSATGRVRLVLRKPLAPTRLQGVVTGGAVQLSWLASRDATSYQLEAGSAPGAANLFVGDIGAATQFGATVGTGIYFVRLRARRSGLLGPATADLAVTVGNVACSAPPPPPTGHAVSTGGPLVDLAWDFSPGATSYQLEAGSAPGAADIAATNVGNRNDFQVNAPFRNYFTRLRAVNACGASAPSNEVAFGVACVGPAAPGDFTLRRVGNAITLSWLSSLGATSYQLQAGTAPGASNVYVGSLGATTSFTFPSTVLPPGIYYLRVSAVGPCGPGTPSTEVALTLP